MRTATTEIKEGPKMYDTGIDLPQKRRIELNMNLKAIRAKGQSLGLIAPGQVISDEDAMQLILEPGFSTAGAITQQAGRGVGMYPLSCIGMNPVGAIVKAWYVKYRRPP